MAVLMQEHANAPIDIARVMKMLLIHDVVEIDAGDTYCYDETGNLDKLDRETAAAKRLFGLLPPDQAAVLPSTASLSAKACAQGRTQYSESGRLSGAV